MNKSIEEKEKAAQHLIEESQKLDQITKEYEKLKTFLLPTLNINKDLIGKYKRGKYIEGIVRQTVQEFTKSNSSLSEAISLK